MERMPGKIEHKHDDHQINSEGSVKRQPVGREADRESHSRAEDVPLGEDLPRVVEPFLVSPDEKPYRRREPEDPDDHQHRQPPRHEPRLVRDALLDDEHPEHADESRGKRHP